MARFSVGDVKKDPMGLQRPGVLIPTEEIRAKGFTDGQVVEVASVSGKFFALVINDFETHPGYRVAVTEAVAAALKGAQTIELRPADPPLATRVTLGSRITGGVSMYGIGPSQIEADEMDNELLKAVRDQKAPIYTLQDFTVERRKPNVGSIQVHRFVKELSPGLVALVGPETHVSRL